MVQDIAHLTTATLVHTISSNHKPPQGGFFVVNIIEGGTGYETEKTSFRDVQGLFRP